LMTQNHFDDETLIKVIEVSETDFDVTGGALIDLKNQGVSPVVLRAMLESVHKNRAAASSLQTAAASPPATASATTQPPDSPESTDPNFATRTSTSAPSAANSTTPAPVSAPPAPAVGAYGSYPANAMAGINPAQLAALQARMASMGMGGMMGNMGMMGGMGGGGFAMNYPPEQMPHVLLRMGPNKDNQEIAPSMAQIGQSNYKGGMGAGGMALRSLSTEGLSFAAMGTGPAGMMAMSAFSMVSGFMPGMRPGAPKITYVWGLPGRNSSRVFDQSNPMFELTYGNIPGVDPDAYEPTVLKLFQTKDNYRLVGATQMKMTAKNMRNGSSPENGKWISEARWPCHVDKEERGFYILHVDSALEPGEYAVVLRPVKGYKQTSSGLGGHAQVFYSVWDFSVPGAVPDNGKKKKKKK
ncbi:MAG: hypothetical protein ACRD3B_14520, partial [Candidatus Sulfotelmatobacter sp.]